MSCQNGGTCYETEFGVRCICRNGYSGDKCQSKILPIYFNFNTLTIMVRNSSVIVPNLWTNFYMQILIVFCNLFYIVRKFCEADTCENNGKCIEHVHGFRCVCPQGYKGKLCDGRYKCTPYRDSYTRQICYSEASFFNKN